MGRWREVIVLGILAMVLLAAPSYGASATGEVKQVDIGKVTDIEFGGYGKIDVYYGNSYADTVNYSWERWARAKQELRRSPKMLKLVYDFLSGKKDIGQVRSEIAAYINNVDLSYYINGNETTQFDPHDIYGIRSRVIAGRNAGTSYSEETNEDVVKHFNSLYQDGPITGGYDDASNDKILIRFEAHGTAVEIAAKSVISPIVLDLDGDGRISASGGEWLPHPEKMYTNNMVAFDIEGTGFEKLVEWVGPGDGLLCTLNNEGKVDGSTLFGTVGGWDNGYEKLSTYDTNNDMQISGKELEGLYVWQDKNGNGVAEKDEVKTLQELGITSLSLKHNMFRSSFTMNGQNRMLVDWWPNVIEVRRLAIVK